MPIQSLTPILLPADPTVALHAATKQYVDSLSLQAGQIATEPVGTILAWAGSVSPPPIGYILCDGHEEARVAYPDLFIAIGTTFGVGNGTTTFNMPDFTSKFALGVGSGHPLTGAGSNGGAETVTLSSAQIPAHTHPVADPGHPHTASSTVNGSPSYSNQYGEQSIRTSYYESGYGLPAVGTWVDRGLITNNASEPPHAHTASTTVTGSYTGVTVSNNTGGGGSHENMPPYRTINYIIKAVKPATGNLGPGIEIRDEGILVISGGTLLNFKGTQVVATAIAGGTDVTIAGAPSGAEATQIAKPASPSTGNNKLYFKSDNKLYMLDSTGVEKEVGTGASSGSIPEWAYLKYTAANAYIPTANTIVPLTLVDGAGISVAAGVATVTVAGVYTVTTTNTVSHAGANKSTSVFGIEQRRAGTLISSSENYTITTSLEYGECSTTLTATCLVGDTLSVISRAELASMVQWQSGKGGTSIQRLVGAGPIGPAGPAGTDTIEWGTLGAEVYNAGGFGKIVSNTYLTFSALKNGNGVTFAAGGGLQANKAGTYVLNAVVTVDNGAGPTPATYLNFVFHVRRAGTTVYQSQVVDQTQPVASYTVVSLHDIVDLQAGDQVFIFASHSASATALTLDSRSHASIHRLAGPGAQGPPGPIASDTLEWLDLSLTAVSWVPTANTTNIVPTTLVRGGSGMTVNGSGQMVVAKAGIYDVSASLSVYGATTSGYMTMSVRHWRGAASVRPGCEQVLYLPASGQYDTGAVRVQFDAQAGDIFELVVNPQSANFSIEQSRTQFTASRQAGPGPGVEPRAQLADRFQDILSGGGQRTVVISGVTSQVTWSKRIMGMGAGRNSIMNPNGYLQIDPPAAGVVAPVFAHSSRTTITSVTGGFPLETWDTLYYEPGYGSSVSGFRVVNYQGDFTVPDHWIFIATQMADGPPMHQHVKWWDGREDSGLVQLGALSAGWSGNGQYRRLDNQVQVSLAVVKSTWGVNDVIYAAGSLPVGCYPWSYVTASGMNGAINNASRNWWVGLDGSIKAGTTGDGSIYGHVNYMAYS